MTFSEWLNLILGAGFLGSIITLIKLFVIDKKKNDAETQHIVVENNQKSVEIEDMGLLQISNKIKIVNELLKDAENSAEMTRKLRQRENELVIQNQNLDLESKGQKQVIDYQKDERKDWMEMLKTTLDANAKREKDFGLLCLDVEQLKTKEENCQSNVTNLEGRLNVMIGILKQNNLDVPEGFVWTNSATNITYPQSE